MCRRLLLMLALVLCAVAFTDARARAAEPDWRDGPIHGFTSVKAGMFIPSDDAVGERFDEVGYHLSLRVGVLAEHEGLAIGEYRLPGTFGLWLEGGFHRADGRVPVSPRPATTLYMLPVMFGVEWAARFSEEQLLVPYVGAGYGAAYFHSKTETSPVEKVDGARFGWSGEAGLRVHLDRFDRAAARAARHNIGTSNTFADFRARYQSINGFDTGIDLSGLVFDAGLTIEF